MTLTGSIIKPPLVPIVDAGSRPRILIVEDNAVNLEIARAGLEHAGYLVFTAVNGFEALSIVAGESFDLVLMDCQMPELDGYDASRAIRETERIAGSTFRLPIIALTANAMTGDREQCLLAGMDDYLGKPFSRAELLAVIARWLPTQHDIRNLAT